MQPSNTYGQPSNTYGDLTWESNTYGDLTWESDELCMSVNELVIYQNGSPSRRYSISSLQTMSGYTDNFEEEELNESLSEEELLEQSLPDSLNPVATLTNLMQVLREHHTYADIVIHYSEQFPMRILAIITQIFSLFFIYSTTNTIDAIIQIGHTRTFVRNQPTHIYTFNTGALEGQWTPSTGYTINTIHQ